MKGEVDQVVDVDKLGAQAQEKLKELGDKAKDFDIEKLGAGPGEAQGARRQGQGHRRQEARCAAQEKLKELGSSSSGGPAKADSTGRIRATVEALEKRTQEALDEAKALNEPRQQP